MDTESLMTFDAPGACTDRFARYSIVSPLIQAGNKHAAMQASSRALSQHAGAAGPPPVLNSLTETTALSVGEVSRDTSGCSATTTCTTASCSGAAAAWAAAAQCARSLHIT